MAGRADRLGAQPRMSAVRVQPEVAAPRGGPGRAPASPAACRSARAVAPDPHAPFRVMRRWRRLHEPALRERPLEALMTAETPALATPEIAEANAALRMRLPFANTEDFDDARRGWMGSLSDPVIRATDGTVVWDAGAYAFLDAECPNTVNPSLWRQSQLAAIHGLFEVADGIYQVRGLDLSDMTIVEGDTGVIVIDPLISTECAAAALGMYRAHRGDRKVVAVIYTHSHVDHFGGVLGVTNQADVDAGTVLVIAPEGFTEHAIQENVYAGTAMTRRASYMYGT